MSLVVLVKRLAEPVLVLLLAVVSTAVLTYPLVMKMDRVGRVNTGDGQLSIWNVAWVAHALTTDPLHLYDANIFYPHRKTLAFSEPNIGAGLLATPVWMATRNPYFAHNSAVVLSFLFAVIGSYVLGRYLTGHRGAAVFAALAFAFCPYIYARMAHVQLLMTAGLPWSLWACHRFIDRVSASRAIVLGVILGAQGLACGYYGFFAGLSVGTAVLFYAAVRGMWRQPRYWSHVIVAAAISLACVVPFLLPFWQIEGADFGARCNEAADFSANWQAYLASPTYAHRWMLPFLEGYSEVTFPGFLAIGLAGVAVILAASGRLRAGMWTGTAEDNETVSRPAETVALYVVVGVLAFWSSFGPSAGLYSVLCETVPAFGFMRAPQRLGIVVILALVVCSAIAVTYCARTLRRGGWVTAVLIAAVVGELTAAPLEFPEVNVRPDPVYRTLAHLPRGVLAEFPFFYMRPDFHRHAYYMLASTAHWLPLVNGYSDYIPQDFRDMVIDVSSFPTRAAFRLLRERKVRYVVFHLDFYDHRSVEKLMDRLRQYDQFLRPIVKDDATWLYEITGWPR